MPRTERELRGLGGWLILLAIGLIGMPGNLLEQAQEVQRHFTVPALQAHTTPGSPNYDPRWQALAVIETSACGIAIIPAIILIFLFFFKHRSFPIAFSALTCLMMSFTIVRLCLVLTIPTVAPSYKSAFIPLSIGSLLVSGLWIAYIFRSERVRLTFTRRFYLRPLFPFFTSA